MVLRNSVMCFFYLSCISCFATVLLYYQYLHDAVDMMEAFEVMMPQSEQRGAPASDIGGSKTIKTTDVLTELDILSRGPDDGDAGRTTLECPHPLVPSQNVIARDEDDDKLRKGGGANIPKILHLSYASRCLPRDIAAIIDRWKQVLPNHSIFFHDDEAVARLFQEEWTEREFPGLHDAMKCVMYKGAMKIDVWRVLMLVKYGGVYSDIDNWPLDAFNEDTIRPDLSAFFLRDGWNRPSQWFMAAEPRHPIMTLSMQYIVGNILSLDNIQQPRVLFVTGPHVVKAGYEKFVRNGNETLDSDTQVFVNNQILTGMHNKTVFKCAREDLIISKHGYNDIVPFNSTLNVTRETRIEMDGGVIHWQKTIYRYKKKIPSISCKAYLEKFGGNGTFDGVEAI